MAERMLHVRISTSGVRALKFSMPQGHLKRLEVVNGASDVRQYLLEAFEEGRLLQRPDWSVSRINQALAVSIPEMDLQYTLAAEAEEQELAAHTLAPEEPSSARDCPPEAPWSPEEASALEKPSSQLQSKTHPRGKGRMNWTPKATLRLIFHWKERRSRFANNTERKEDIWTELADAMVAEGYSEINATHCENKFKYIKRVYTETKDINRKSTGQPEKTCPYYEELDELFKKSPQITPLILASNIDGPPQFIVPDIPPSPPEEVHPTPPKKKTRLESSLTGFAESIENKMMEREATRQQRHEEMMALQRESNEIYKKFMEKLLEKL